MEIRGYANTKDGCHVCVDCTTEEEKEKEEFTPLGLSDLYEYKYADYDDQSADDFNQPSCDRCLKPLKAEHGDAKATEVDKIASRIIKQVMSYIPNYRRAKYHRNDILSALGKECRKQTHEW